MRFCICLFCCYNFIILFFLFVCVFFFFWSSLSHLISFVVGRHRMKSETLTLTLTLLPRVLQCMYDLNAVRGLFFILFSLFSPLFSLSLKKSNSAMPTAAREQKHSRTKKREIIINDDDDNEITQIFNTERYHQTNTTTLIN